MPIMPNKSAPSTAATLTFPTTMLTTRCCRIYCQIRWYLCLCTVAFPSFCERTASYFHYTREPMSLKILPLVFVLCLCTAAFLLEDRELPPQKISRPAANSNRHKNSLHRDAY